MTCPLLLAGAHTIGSAHCSVVKDQFKEDSQTRETETDPSLNRPYAQELIRKRLADGAELSATASNDPQTTFAFGNQYYKNLMQHKRLLRSDSALMEDDRTKNIVEEYATNQESYPSSLAGVVQEAHFDTSETR